MIPLGTDQARRMMRHTSQPEGVAPSRHSITRSYSTPKRSANCSHNRPASSNSRSSRCRSLPGTRAPGRSPLHVCVNPLSHLLIRATTFIRKPLYALAKRTSPGLRVLRPDLHQRAYNVTRPFSTSDFRSLCNDAGNLTASLSHIIIAVSYTRMLRSRPGRSGTGRSCRTFGLPATARRCRIPFVTRCLSGEPKQRRGRQLPGAI